MLGLDTQLAVVRDLPGPEGKWEMVELIGEESLKTSLSYLVSYIDLIGAKWCKVVLLVCCLSKFNTCL